MRVCLCIALGLALTVASCSSKEQPVPEQPLGQVLFGGPTTSGTQEVPSPVTLLEVLTDFDANGEEAAVRYGPEGRRPASVEPKEHAAFRPVYELVILRTEHEADGSWRVDLDVPEGMRAGKPPFEVHCQIYAPPGRPDIEEALEGYLPGMGRVFGMQFTEKRGATLHFQCYDEAVRNAFSQLHRR